MSYFDREQIANALLALLTGAGTPWNASGRLWRTWTDARAYPALFLRDGDEKWVAPRPNELRRQVVLEFEAWVYVAKAGADAVAATGLNQAVAAVDNALIAGPVPGLVTLGGLVRHCWIEGELVKDTGEYSGQPTAMVPIKVLAI